MKATRTASQQGIDNKDLIEMLGHAIRETESPHLLTERNFLRGNNAFERPRLPASVLFHYRNHPNMLALNRERRF
jgi:hypothetical protein